MGRIAMDAMRRQLQAEAAALQNKGRSSKDTVNSPAGMDYAEVFSSAINAAMRSKKAMGGNLSKRTDHDSPVEMTFEEIVAYERQTEDYVKPSTITTLQTQPDGKIMGKSLSRNQSYAGDGGPRGAHSLTTISRSGSNNSRTHCAPRRRPRSSSTSSASRMGSLPSALIPAAEASGDGTSQDEAASAVHAQHSKLMQSQEEGNGKFPGNGKSRQGGLGAMAWTAEHISPASKSRADKALLELWALDTTDMGTTLAQPRPYTAPSVMRAATHRFVDRNSSSSTSQRRPVDTTSPSRRQVSPPPNHRPTTSPAPPMGSQQQAWAENGNAAGTEGGTGDPRQWPFARGGGPAVGTDVIFEEEGEGEEEWWRSEDPYEEQQHNRRARQSSPHRQEKPGLYRVMRKAPHQLTTASSPYLLGMPIEMLASMEELPCLRDVVAAKLWHPPAEAIDTASHQELCKQAEAATLMHKQRMASERDAQRAEAARLLQQQLDEKEARRRRQFAPKGAGEFAQTQYTVTNDADDEGGGLFTGVKLGKFQQMMTNMQQPEEQLAAEQQHDSPRSVYRGAEHESSKGGERGSPLSTSKAPSPRRTSPGVKDGWVGREARDGGRKLDSQLGFETIMSGPEPVSDEDGSQGRGSDGKPERPVSSGLRGYARASQGTGALNRRDEGYLTHLLEGAGFSQAKRQQEEEEEAQAADECPYEMPAIHVPGVLSQRMQAKRQQIEANKRFAERQRLEEAAWRSGQHKGKLSLKIPKGFDFDTPERLRAAKERRAARDAKIREGITLAHRRRQEQPPMKGNLPYRELESPHRPVTSPASFNQFKAIQSMDLQLKSRHGSGHISVATSNPLAPNGNEVRVQ